MLAWFSSFTPPVKPNAKKRVQNELSSVSAPISAGKISGIGLIGGNCNIEVINGSPFGSDVYVVAHDADLMITGWAMDKDHLRLPKSVVIRLTSAEDLQYFISAQVGFQRSDVITYFSLTDDMLTSGFELNTNLQSVPAGEYIITLVMILEDTAMICDNGRKILVQ